MSTNGRFSRQTESLIIVRDMGKCVRCGAHVTHLDRGRDWSLHHRRARGMGGTSLEWVGLPANGIVLCGHGTSGCHGWVEAHREESYELGYLVRANGRLRADEVPVTHGLHGLVLLTDAGGVVLVGDPEADWSDAA